jgi:hypothetical protein
MNDGARLSVNGDRPPSGQFVRADSRKVMRKHAGCQTQVETPMVEDAKKNGAADGRPELRTAVTENR